MSCLGQRFAQLMNFWFIIFYIVHFADIFCNHLDATNKKKCLNHLKSGPGRSEGEPIFHPDDFSEGI